MKEEKMMFNYSDPNLDESAVTGAEFVAQLKNPDVERITLYSRNQPSIGFLDAVYKNYGFYFVGCERKDVATFATTLNREEKAA